MWRGACPIRLQGTSRCEVRATKAMMSWRHCRLPQRRRRRRRRRRGGQRDRSGCWSLTRYELQRFRPCQVGRPLPESCAFACGDAAICPQPSTDRNGLGGWTRRRACIAHSLGGTAGFAESRLVASAHAQLRMHTLRGPGQDEMVPRSKVLGAPPPPSTVRGSTCHPRVDDDTV